MSCLAAACIFGTAIQSHAQIINYAQSGNPAQSGLELLQEEPHDIIYFTEKAGGGWVKVHLLDLPGRKMPIDRSGALIYRIIDIEAKDFTSKWSDIETIDFWETRLERETKERIAKADFKGAYPFLSILIRDFPDRPGLRQLRSDFLWTDAITRAKRGEREATLAMLEELLRYAPEYKASSVRSAIDLTTDRLMQSMVDENRLADAQRLLARLEKDYQTVRLKSIPKWNQEFLKMATAKRDEAIEAVNAKDYRAARQLARESINLKPEIAGGEALVKKIDQIYPLVNVGVLQSASVFDPTRIDNWSSRRAGRLQYRVLFEMQGAGPEGGEYDFLFGSVEQSPDRLNLDLVIEDQKLVPPLDGISGFHIADVLADRARPESPEYFSAWAAAVKAIGLSGPRRMQCLLRRPHVLPTCLLQVPVDGSWFGGEPGSPSGEYRLDSSEPRLSRFVLAAPPKQENQPREIVEIRPESASDAVSMLLQGEVDVLDQLFPADAIRLKNKRSVQVENYPLPTVHMLIPCSDHLYLAERTFRRALVYGINREDILSGELLEGLESPGCRVVSGPFPAGVELNDPLGYAYDKSIEPRSYEPRVAKLLMTLAESQMKAAAQRKKEALPPLEPIRLAFPADNLSRVACEAIRSQWMLLGLQVELVELPVGRTFPEEGTADIVYSSVAVWEPIIDARRLLGPQGLAGSTDQLVGLGLRRIEEAKNWKEVRDRLIDLHGIAHHELPVLPLWQLVESYAYRKEILGIGRGIVSLYQDVDKWRLE
tara:strand:- start:77253 stop:79556 length:2304 start_codon:yes stop_codon:yes gene_type:complete